ncbi:ATP-binding cassette domain-containing protein [Joostella sp. CR20]|uniref:ATP-binding cassette domain-containing protein n=1 Tax=Joostella sp. CR20 TaxID=2804312 RepID=UPI00313D0C03
MSLQVQTNTIQLKAISYTTNHRTILNDISLNIPKGTSLAIVGNSGSGKTTLARIIAEEKKATSGTFINPFQTIFVSQQDHFSEISGMSSTYYSKRYEFHDYENQLKVNQYLEKLKVQIGLDKSDTHEDSLLQYFGIAHLVDKNLLQLSNGERKKLQLVSALIQQPEVLVLDQPFTGLDVASRKLLVDYLAELQLKGISVILVCDGVEVPSFVNNVVVLAEGNIIAEGVPSKVKMDSLETTSIDTSVDIDDLLAENSNRFETVVGMKNVNVSMNGKAILNDINWQIKQGECWALVGHNGAGKSTLLSLITADNPQGYRNDLTLFDRKRGSGESIWEIKQHIGFLSPELHLYFMRGKGIANSVPGIITSEENYSTLTCSDVIISGFKDEIGTVSIPTKHQEDIAVQWLNLVKLSHLEKALFVNASLGEQRVLLLLRALVKSPSLLILDEPCQGMDANQTQYFKRLLDRICVSKHITMIYVSHRSEEIPESVSNILTLNNGSVVL